MLRRAVSYGLLPIAILAACGSAFAQKRAVDPGYSYEFEVDFLDGDDLTGDGPRLVVRGGHARVLLIRPRTNFVPELLKSTETL